MTASELPAVIVPGADGGPTVAETLAQHVIALAATPLDDDTRNAATDVVLDWFAATWAGAVEVPAQALLTGLRPGPGRARIVGQEQRVEPAAAALVNGTAAHTLEVDDIYSPGTFHPGAPIIAAALAVADDRAATGEQFMRAVVAGYEVGARVARDLGPAHYAHWHTTGTVGGIGAAVAVAYLLDATADQLADAIALAATMAGGLQQTFRRDTLGKPLHAGHAAQVGVVAGSAAVSGLTGARDALEGEAGLGVATGAPSAWAAATGPLDPNALLIREITFKPYPCCGHAFAAIDCGLELRAQGVRADQLRHLRIGTYAAAISVAGNPDPPSPFAARFSIAYTTLAALGHGEVNQQSFTPTALADPQVRPYLDRVSLHVDAACDAAFPDRRGASAVAELADGREIAVTVPERSGGPGNPLTPAAAAAKVHGLVASVSGDDVATRVIADLRGVWTAPAVP